MTPVKRWRRGGWKEGLERGLKGGGDWKGWRGWREIRGRSWGVLGGRGFGERLRGVERGWRGWTV